ncbi:hypothetical protein V496_09232 [Pseudogymnoascus sp. VKM F-4515 (FW-2607)]|nr:hypothetical protein V496_09232 [Pseudogymnoascus sp. VKM F-4515 (FW-2607)]
MVRLREIPRTAAFAWSPGTGLPILVTGTRAGAVDADFSDETKLELWDLNLDNLEQGVELQPVASISTDSRFHDIAWAPPNENHPKGIIAGALDNGSLDLWDAQKLLEGSSDAFISRTSTHAAAIKSLQFNPLKPDILATAGAKGELYIYDVNDMSNGSRLGNPQARSDDLECIAWNRKVPHILATGSVGGFVTVWDLKTKKATLTLNNSRKAVGAIAWDPNNPTKLLTATPDDSTPVIQLWDLRNSNAPERTLQGHEQGVLSLSWCEQDSDILLSSGKDNKTICWNPQTGELLGEFPEATNWTFQTRFNPHNPNLSATASFDGKISVQTLQNTNQPVGQGATNGLTDGEDFFNKAQTQPQGSSFTLPKAPKWIERPIGASFGFGGKLVIFSQQPTVAGGQRSSKIQLLKFSADSGVATATEAFETSLESGDLLGICKSHIESANTDEETADWEVIKALVAESPRKSVTEYLGFSEAEDASIGVDDATALDADAAKDSEITPDLTSKAKNNRLSTYFNDSPDTDDFLSDLAPTKTAKTNDPFHLLSDTDSQSDREITRALMLGQFEHAMSICLKDDRMADAFVIANCGGKELLAKAQKAYLAAAAKGPKYLRLLAAVTDKNLWDIVYNADLANWKDSMATLCTYADPTEFPDLCEALGDRIFESGGSRKNASLCYLVGSKLDKVVGIWISELHEQKQEGLEKPGDDTNFSVHAHLLQNFIEKVTVFRKVTNFVDTEQDSSDGWKLGPLYERYVEYADILASHGFLDSAEKYLNLLPVQYLAADVARNRVKQASKKATQQIHARQQQPAVSRTVPRPQQTSSFPSQQRPVEPARVANPYAPSPSAHAPSPYAPPAPAYGSQQAYIPNQPQGNYGAPSMPPPTGFSQDNAYGQFGAPPRNTTPSQPPPSKAKDMTNWNDTPMVTKPSISRRGTPGTAPAPITSPFPNQPNLAVPPSAPPFGAPPRGTPTPPPPPPKGSMAPRVASPLGAGHPPPFGQPSRSSPNPNTYAPAHAQGYSQTAPPPAIARGPSPYNAPPSGPPATNRYAPAPAAQQPFQQAPGQVPPPPHAGFRPPPPSNPYAPQQPSQAQAPYNQQQYQHTQPGPGPVQTEPPRGTVSTSRPGTSQGQAPKPSAPSSNYPPGDRSHIPSFAQDMVGIFSNDMQRVASKAPPNFAAQVKDTQKRLNILFDHLNNGELVKPDTIEKLGELSQALQAKNYDMASRIQVDIQREKLDECGNWMVGVKRLISMSKVTP